MSFSEVDGDFRAYRVLKHQHTPEIERALALAGQPARCASPSRPTCCRLRRGILATVYGRLVPGQDRRGRRGGHRGVRRRPAVPAGDEAGGGPPARRWSGTNRVLLGADADPERGVAIAFAAIDNLVKGAAGQAVQNANLMLGLDETAGLDLLGGTAP